jgi:hypothetical protein
MNVVSVHLEVKPKYIIRLWNFSMSTKPDTRTLAPNYLWNRAGNIQTPGTFGFWDGLSQVLPSPVVNANDV